LSKEYSLIDPKHFMRLIFIDIAGFMVQIVGIVLCFMEVTPATGLDKASLMGGQILAAGAALHVISLTCFVTLFGWVLIQALTAYRKSARSTFLVHVSYTFKFKIFIVVLVGVTACLWGRGIYTTLFWACGFDSGVARNEIPFTAFEGLLTSQAVIGMVAVHPGGFLDEAYQRKLDSEKGASSHDHGRGHLDTNSFWRVPDKPARPPRPVTRDSQGLFAWRRSNLI
jgi:hypothetical protein